MGAIALVLPRRTQRRPSVRAPTLLRADAPRPQQTGGAGEAPHAAKRSNGNLAAAFIDDFRCFRVSNA